MEKLNREFQERLDKWRQKTIPVPSAEIFKKKNQNYVARKEYGDETETPK